MASSRVGRVLWVVASSGQRSGIIFQARAFIVDERFSGWEKIEKLKREKTTHSTEELDCLGWSRYQEIKGELEAKHHGEYVMIEVDSGDYFVGGTPEEALCRARAIHSNKAFYLIRIGYRAAHKLKLA